MTVELSEADGAVQQGKDQGNSQYTYPAPDGGGIRLGHKALAIQPQPDQNEQGNCRLFKIEAFDEMPKGGQRQDDQGDQPGGALAAPDAGSQQQ